MAQIVLKIYNRANIAFIHDVIMASISFVIALFLRLGSSIEFYSVDLLILGTGIFTAVAAVVFHMLAADALGFVTTSAIILFLTSKLLGARLLTSAIVAMVASVGIYQLFSGLLRVPLPIGGFFLF